MNRSRRVLLALVALVAAIVLTSPSPADAAARRHFSDVYACGTATGSKTLHLQVRAGYWTDVDGNVVRGGNICFSELLDTWHPSISGFNAVIRWSVGHRVVKVTRVRVRNTGGFEDESTLVGSRFVLTCDELDSAAELQGQPVTVRTTLKRPHYATRTIKTCYFGVGGYDCG